MISFDERTFASGMLICIIWGITLLLCFGIGLTLSVPTERIIQVNHTIEKLVDTEITITKTPTGDFVVKPITEEK